MERKIATSVLKLINIVFGKINFWNLWSDWAQKSNGFEGLHYVCDSDTLSKPFYSAVKISLNLQWPHYVLALLLNAQVVLPVHLDIGKIPAFKNHLMFSVKFCKHCIVQCKLIISHDYTNSTLIAGLVFPNTKKLRKKLESFMALSC